MLTDATDQELQEFGELFIKEIAGATRKLITEIKNKPWTHTVIPPSSKPYVPGSRPPYSVTKSTGHTNTAPAVQLPVDSLEGKGERTVLTAIAQHPAGVTRSQLTLLTGYKRSTRDRYLQYLQQKQFVDVGERIGITSAGMLALGDGYEPLPTGDALREQVLQTLPQGESKILSVIVAHYPQPVSREAITEATGFQRSTRDRYLQYLGARELVTPVGRGEVKAAEELFG
jgi:chromosome segregation and condensation protein ScpB